MLEGNEKPTIRWFFGVGVGILLSFFCFCLFDLCPGREREKALAFFNEFFLGGGRGGGGWMGEWGGGVGGAAGLLGFGLHRCVL